MSSSGRIVGSDHCPECNKSGHGFVSKNLCMYEDEDTGESTGSYCHACGYTVHPDGEGTDKKEKKMAGNLLTDVGEVESIPSRKLTKDTCRKYGITTSGNCVVFPIVDCKGNVVAQKIKNLKTGKRDTKGDQSEGVLFGRHLFKSEGKRVIVTEGELDAPSAFQVLSNKSVWPVVSIICGADNSEGKKKITNEIRKNYDWLNGFDEIVFCFDNDPQGIESAKAAAALFPPGKAFITKLTCNDPSDYLQEGRSSDLYKDIWASPAWRPDGIVSVSEVSIGVKYGEILRYTSPVMTMKMLGRKPHTMTGLVSGTGSGKTTLVMQQTEQDLEDGVKVGGIFLEGTPSMTLEDLAGIRMGKRVRQILAQRSLLEQHPELQDFAEFEDNLDDDELAETVEWIKGQDLHLLDHFGRAKPDEILKSIEYLSTGLGCQEIILDHISKVQVSDNTELDSFVDALQSMTKRLPSHLTIISQLNQGDGSKTHEEGKRTTLRDIRGSQVVVSSFDEILAFSRNQYAEDDVEKNTVYIDCLKNRLGGFTGFIETREYNTTTGRLLDVNDTRDSFEDESTNTSVMENLV